MAATPKTHPLEHSWTLWYDSKKSAARKSAKDATNATPPPKPEVQSADNWEDNLVTIDTVTSVEAFWVMFKQIKPPSNLELAANYHFFKKGIKPMWEDPANVNGGKWVLQLTSKEDLYRVDSIWEELTLSLIGEYLDEGVNGDHIVGAVLSKRRNAVRLSLWVRDAKAKESLDILAKRLAEILKVDAKQTSLTFLAHNSTTPIPAAS